MNNATYITWALEALPAEFRMAHKLKTLDIYFKKEAVFGDTIASHVRLDTDTATSTHVLKNRATNETLCSIAAKFVTV